MGNLPNVTRHFAKHVRECKEAIRKLGQSEDVEDLTENIQDVLEDDKEEECIVYTPVIAMYGQLYSKLSKYSKNHGS